MCNCETQRHVYAKTASVLSCKYLLKKKCLCRSLSLSVSLPDVCGELWLAGYDKQKRGPSQIFDGKVDLYVMLLCNPK